MKCTECKGMTQIKAEDFAIFNCKAFDFMNLNTTFIGFARVNICKECLSKKIKSETQENLEKAKLNIKEIAPFISMSILAIIAIAGGFGDRIIDKIIGSVALLINIGFLVSYIIKVPKKKANILKKQNDFVDDLNNNFKKISLFDYFPDLEGIKINTLFNARYFVDFSDKNKLIEYIESKDSKKDIGTQENEYLRRYISIIV
ncbi:MAG: hypothetical protein LBC86_01685 [Oscillospiraceae bacterium]|jgi:hypothetical protein|nr:hypothetical protein [Oscillospiraceae bacterium]